MSNNKLVSSFNIFQTKSSKLCLIDPMILFYIIVAICLLLYVIGYKLNKTDLK
jgi:hypothetical protein